MNTSALILMVSVQLVITAFTIYFFWKVAKNPPGPEPDSFEENDDETK